MTLSSVDWLLQHSHSYPLLTAEQEIIYSRHVQEWLELRDKPKPTKREQAIIRRGKRAYDRFFLSNIRMVIHLAQRYKRFLGSMALEDLMMEGIFGLERAIVKYDATRGYKFSTYAFNWIRQSINRSLSKYSRMIRLPDNAIVIIRKAYDYMTEHQRMYGRRPSVEEIADHCNVSVYSLKAYLPHGAPVISLDEQCSNARSDSSSLIELIADQDNTNEVDDYEAMQDVLQELIKDLNAIDRHIIQRLYYHGDNGRGSLKAISQEVGVSRQAVAQRHSAMLRRLRLKLVQTERPDIPALQCA